MLGWVTMVLVHCALCKDVVVGQSSLQSWCCHWWWLFLAGHFGEAFLFFCFSLLFFSCSMRPWCLNFLGHFVVRRPDVIGIFLILIYSSYAKKNYLNNFLQFFIHSEGRTKSFVSPTLDISITIDSMTRKIWLSLEI